MFDPAFDLLPWLDEMYASDPVGWFETFSLIMRTPVQAAGRG